MPLRSRACANVDGKLAAQQMPAGDVDGHRDLGELGDCRPLDQLAGCLVEHPAIEIDDQRRCLGDGYERVWLLQPVPGPVPPDQRLDADELGRNPPRAPAGSAAARPPPEGWVNARLSADSTSSRSTIAL